MRTLNFFFDTKSHLDNSASNARVSDFQEEKKIKTIPDLNYGLYLDKKKTYFKSLVAVKTVGEMNLHSDYESNVKQQFGTHEKVL